MDHPEVETAPSPPPFQEEDECRVCRGPAEDGYPLFSPCKCSGSIGLTHQDCLASWLKVQRGDGRCELCSTKFRFAPQYAESAPEELPWYEVILGISRSTVAKWLPFVLRISLALMLWLFCVPLATAYSYLAWIHSPSSISQRWTSDLVASDTISGAVVAGIVIISFLSLMSFADFLRFNPNQGGQGNRNDNEAAVHAVDVDIDDGVLDHNHIVRRQRNVNAVGVMDQRQPLMAANPHRRVHWMDEVDGPRHMERLLEGLPDNPDVQREVLQRRIRAAAALQIRLDVMEGVGNEHQRPNNDEGPIPFGPEDEARIARFLRDMEGDEDDEDEANVRRNNFEPQFEPLDQAMDQGANPDDMEVNLALDELLGFRGPFGAMIRNILWFMVFMVSYLGIFVALPRFFGKAVLRRFSDTSILPSFVSKSSSWNATEPDHFGLVQLVDKLNAEGQRLNRTLQLNDLALLVSGYLVIASGILLIQLSVTIRQRLKAGNDNIIMENEGALDRERRPVDAQPAFDNEEGFAMHDDAENQMTISQFLSLALTCAGAFVKVGVLLFLKMLFLPLTLGIWLDAATMSAFGESPLSRVLYAGHDLFSSLLIHWVVGITFMLMVTVSVLQLREVMHPGILAPLIRPQEPQPDLLGNMMNESGMTHARRMALSFCIYAFLLAIYIWLPARLLLLSGLNAYVPFLRPKLWYLVTPQLQVPIELLIFHLAMLSFLEKYKNNIGGMQHHWLKAVCAPLGLLDYLLPREISRFELVGWKPIFTQPDDFEPDMLDDLSDITPTLTEATSATCVAYREETKHNGIANQDTPQLRMLQVDTFWYELAKLKVGAAEYIEAHMIRTHNNMHRFESPHFKRNGKCTVQGCKEFIRLPLPAAEQDVADRRRRRPAGIEPDDETKDLVPSTLGFYRLRRLVRDDGSMVIEFWKECRGDVVARPPEGWDDLGVGGAESQGRWAWGNERKSRIEEGIAVRKPFFGIGIPKTNSALLICQVILLLLISWAAVAILVVVAASAPIATGRFVLHLLRLPDQLVHDPFALAIGVAVLSHIVRALPKLLTGTNASLIYLGRSFRRAPLRKTAVVSYSLFMWAFGLPLLLGITYDLLLVKSHGWFMGELPLISVQDILQDWATGSVLLNLWALMCLKSAFTFHFWAQFGNMAFEAVIENDNRQQADPPPNAENGIAHWQGSANSRIQRFFYVLSAVILRGEWDEVDPNVLMKDCINPIALVALQVLCFPGMIVAIWILTRLNGPETESVGVVVPHIGLIFEGMFRMLLFRFVCLASIFVHCLSAFQNELKEWFKVVHKAARDDRYLIGEILLNYEEHAR